MYPPTIKRTLKVMAGRITISGGAKPIKIPLKHKPTTRHEFTRCVELVLAAMSTALARIGRKPWDCEVTIVCPERMEYGFQRSGLRIKWPEVVPNPKARATR